MNLSKDEQELLDAVEAGEFESVLTNERRREFNKVTADDIARIGRVAEKYRLAPLGVWVVARLDNGDSMKLSELPRRITRWMNALGPKHDKSLFAYSPQREISLTPRGRSVAARLMDADRILRLQNVARTYRLTNAGLQALVRLEEEGEMLLPSGYTNWRSVFGQYHDRGLFTYSTTEDYGISKVVAHLTDFGLEVAAALHD